MKTWSKYFLAALVVLLISLSWQKMIFFAETIPPFLSDEIANNQMAVSFFTSGDYYSDRYKRVYSSGFVVTWPGAIGYRLGHNLLSIRLTCAFFTWLFAFILLFYIFRRQGCETLEAAAIATSVWAVYITSPLAFPYWFGFMYNLGELNSFLLIALGFLLLSRTPLLSAFIFGLAVWHGKYLYLALVWAILLGDLFSQKLSLKQYMVKILQYVGIFFLPFLLWLVWLAAKFGIPAVKEWINSQWGWFSYMKDAQEPLKPVIFSLKSLSERLHSPELEWVGYSKGTQLKTLMFSLGAIVLTMVSLLFSKIGRLNLSRREVFISLMVCLSIALYSFIYFFTHPFMWQRHFQPAIYSGLALWIFWVWKWVKSSSFNLKPLFYTAVFLLVVLGLIQAKGFPLGGSTDSYARSCNDLYGPQCDQTLYK
jgi:hypothetical protein